MYPLEFFACPTTRKTLLSVRRALVVFVVAVGDSFTEVRREKSLSFSLLSGFIGPVLVRFPDNVRMRAAV